MWVEEISIESFGACKHVMISDLGPGLTVIVGPNEAGKSTILEFMRCIFFGFRRKSGRTNIYETPEACAAQDAPPAGSDCAGRSAGSL